MKFPGDKFLVFSPHVDDSDIGMGGTIARLTKENKRVKVVLVTASPMMQSSGERVSREVRTEEFRAAQKELKSQPEVLGWRLETYLHLHITRLIGVIEQLQRRMRADTWFLPAPSYHQDHRAVFEACMSAARPVTDFAPKAIFKYEMLTYFGNPRGLKFDPHCYVDISESICTKLAAIQAHKSQLGQQPYMNTSAIKKWMEFRGFEAGVAHAEAFEIERLLL